MKKLRVGHWGERLARLYLCLKGYRILAMNVRTPAGELDIVALFGEVLVIVEVRTLRGRSLEDPLDAICTAKQRQVVRVGRHWLSGPAGQAHRARSVRFDALVVDLSRARILHVPDAFAGNDEDVFMFG